jgi:hypothetical protein
MSLATIMENWSEYDNKKKKSEDSRFFACTESWEVEYLISRITKVYPYKSKESIKAVIEACCKQINAPRPREKFVQCVLTRLV